jgi:hypothetical protein
MKYFRYILVLGVILIIPYSSMATLKNLTLQVIVEPHPEYKETTYSIIDGDKNKISITTYQTELNKGIVRLRSNSNLPLKKQIDLLSKVLDRVWKDENKTEVHTLFIGRLGNAFGEGNTQMSERLAMAAYRSPGWNKIKGKPVSGHENYFVVKLANQAMIYPELEEIFRKHGLSITFSSAEKVLMGSPTKYIPFGDSLKEQGVEDSATLPFDCLTWFKISK